MHTAIMLMVRKEDEEKLLDKLEQANTDELTIGVQRKDYNPEFGGVVIYQP